MAGCAGAQLPCAALSPAHSRPGPTPSRVCVQSVGRLYATVRVPGPLTSQILDEVLQLHLPLRFDVGAVHVCVEQDDGKGQDENGVYVLDLPNHPRVADAVPLAGGREREQGQDHFSQGREWV